MSGHGKGAYAIAAADAVPLLISCSGQRDQQYNCYSKHAIWVSIAWLSLQWYAMIAASDVPFCCCHIKVRSHMFTYVASTTCCWRLMAFELVLEL